MENMNLEMIKASLAVIWERLNKLEKTIKGGGRLSSPQQYWEELQQEAAKIINQIR